MRGICEIAPLTLDFGVSQVTFWSPFILTAISTTDEAAAGVVSP